jgi:thiamine pyrophosphate-dependent acetolactate synthase large subunit-like protein
MNKERLQEIPEKVNEILLFDSEGGKVTKSSDEYTKNRQLILEILEEDVQWLISEVERLQADNNKLREMREIVANAHQEMLEKSQQKVERLEKENEIIIDDVLANQIWYAAEYMNLDESREKAHNLVKQALETEETA